jgi:hypothetical protein
MKNTPKLRKIPKKNPRDRLKDEELKQNIWSSWKGILEHLKFDYAG